jgi:hypothetical protein
MSQLVELQTKTATVHLRPEAVDAVLDAMDQKGTPLPGTCVVIVRGVMLPLQLTKETVIEKLYQTKVLHG